ncbi:MAG: superoxide reductase [Anaerococcus sp.]|uniref:desulfoferrodoxin family protein n=1 Tax=Anaerococcus sp. TaxID=1872515 RepID=UPI002603B397|nr:desulfoferrodoxin family protein [Anaerococcus sp.]MCI5972673.1 superoxide reductase [Anaerococcus sp.]MDD6919381.1 desulfoferrodoxin family protein [Peptoniphilaceae bacterium]MDY2928001.1 desulfoferrodoxin family protein [Anaerococcus sp.]
MTKLTETVQSGDWKAEKHVPELEVERLEDGKVRVNARVGKEIEHPNTLEHHIAWIKVFFKAEDGKFPVEVGSYQYSAHGEDEIFSEPCASGVIKTEKKGTFYALSYCNIHGLWENSLELD